MEILLIIILFVLALIMPKSKTLYWVIAVFMWLLFAFNTGAPDTGTYKWIYEESIQGAFEPLFTMIMNGCQMARLPYTGFRMVVGALIILLLDQTFRIIKPYKTLALAMYMVAPFPWQISGIRAALACVLLMYGMTFLIDGTKEGKRNYCIVLLLATLVHYSSILFVILLLANSNTSRKRIITVIALAIAGVLAVQNTDYLLDIVSLFTTRDKILTWLSGGPNKDGYPNIKGFIAELIILAGNIYLTKSSAESIEANAKTTKFIDMAESVYALNLITILFVPFLRLNDTYIRLLLVMHGINIVIYSMTAFVLQEDEDSFEEERLVLPVSFKTRFSLYSLIVPFWTYAIALYQNLPYFGTTESVLAFLGENSMFP